MLNSLTNINLRRFVLLIFLVFAFCIGLSYTKVDAFVAYSDQTIRVSWSSGNIQSGTCSGSSGYTGWAGGKGDSGSQTFSGGIFPLYTPYTYTFGCLSSPLSTSAGARIYASDSLTVIPRENVRVALTKTGVSNPYAFTPSLNLTTSSSYVNYGGTYTISWNFNDTYGSCVASGGTGTWAGTKTISGSQTFSNLARDCEMLEFTRTYSMTCTSNGTPVTRSVSLTLKPGFLGSKICSMAL